MTQHAPGVSSNRSDSNIRIEFRKVSKRFAPQDHSAALADFDRTVEQERSAEKALLVHTKILDKARLAWAEAGKELKAVNNLRGRAEDRHFQEATRREQAEMDEAASRIAGASYSLPS